MITPNPVNLKFGDLDALYASLPALQNRYQWQECWLATDSMLIQYQNTLCRLKPRKAGEIQVKFVQGNPDTFQKVVGQLQEALL